MGSTCRVHARIGLMGNPSDGFFGKTIALSLENFWAEVTLRPSDRLRIIPHPEHDPGEYAGLEALATSVSAKGYYGGTRLLLAICKRFWEFCRAKGVVLDGDGSKGCFSLAYDTNIPRQAGLSGSSAIICAALDCMMDFYGVRGRFRKEELPTLILSAEKELGITAGLQDRVIQDFAEERVKETGGGEYTPMDPSLLPPLWLVYADNPSDSGKVHNDVRRRWDEGDVAVREGMVQVAGCAAAARAALEEGDVAALAKAMDKNFDLRRGMFGDACLGAENLKMIETARSVGCAAKFTGSGGAIVAMCPEGTPQASRLKAACAGEGFTVVDVRVAPPRP